MARSMLAGTAVIEGKAGIPKISLFLGLMGYMLPGKPSFCKFSIRMRPILFSLELAPTMAMDSGLKNLSRIWLCILTPSGCVTSDRR